MIILHLLLRSFYILIIQILKISVNNKNCARRCSSREMDIEANILKAFGWLAENAVSCDGDDGRNRELHDHMLI